METYMGKNDVGKLRIPRLSKEELFKELGTSDGGLSDKEAKDRRVKYGENTPVEIKKSPAILGFFRPI
jgi:magnesium-transporting ATPase (P-type)